MPARKHVPQRTCVVCRRVLGKREMFRIVHRAEGGLVVDTTGKLAGRGAYICRQRTCWQRATQDTGRLLARALRITLTDADRQALQEWMQEHAGTLLTESLPPVPEGGALTENPKPV